MKTLVILGILIFGSWGWADTIKVRVRREAPADKEYYQTNEKGNVEKVRKYKGREVRESYNYEKDTGRLVKERKVTK